MRYCQISNKYIGKCESSLESKDIPPTWFAKFGSLNIVWCLKRCEETEFLIYVYLMKEYTGTAFLESNLQCIVIYIYIYILDKI